MEPSKKRKKNNKQQTAKGRKNLTSTKKRKTSVLPSNLCRMKRDVNLEPRKEKEKRTFIKKGKGPHYQKGMEEQRQPGKERGRPSSLFKKKRAQYELLYLGFRKKTLFLKKKRQDSRHCRRRRTARTRQGKKKKKKSCAPSCQQGEGGEEKERLQLGP